MRVAGCTRMCSRLPIVWCVVPLAIAACSADDSPSSPAANASAMPDGGGPGSAGDAQTPKIDGGQTGGPDAGGPRPDAQTSGPALASKYPGDIGIDKDPAVIWAENFEESSVSAVTSRYEDFKNASGMALVNDVPPKSGGHASMRMNAGVSANATDLYKTFANRDELYARWYAKYQAGILWHHSGVWFGGYNPVSNYPNPQAGLKPNGNDRFAIAVEPSIGIGGSAPRLDYYNYWMQMRSWMDTPSGDTAYYGNAMIHSNALTLDEGQWICLEVHVKLNADVSSGKGAVLEVWKNDALIQRLDETGPSGYWLKDNFCTPAADGRECRDYPRQADTIANLQLRNTASLQLNYFWPQNYITEGPDGNLQFDDMVVASERIGCLH